MCVRNYQMDVKNNTLVKINTFWSWYQKGKINQRKVNLDIILKGSVHFDRFSLNQFLFSWLETFFHFEIFEWKLFRTKVGTFELTFLNLILFRSIFLRYESSLKKHSKNAFVIKGVQITVKLIINFWLLHSPKIQSRPPARIY